MLVMQFTSEKERQNSLEFRIIQYDRLMRSSVPPIIDCMYKVVTRLLFLIFNGLHRVSEACIIFWRVLYESNNVIKFH